MLSDEFAADLTRRLAGIADQGLRKVEHQITSAQGVWITLADGRRALNACANDYLGLANHPAIRNAASSALDQRGYGMASVRFICGTQDQHHLLERELATFLGTDDAILFSSCFDANGGLFECLLDEPDAVISDVLNHASIIDGIRLCKARRLRYANADMGDLAKRLGEAADARYRLIVSDGVFSMDGRIAPLEAICMLAEEHGALVVVDDSHATGFVGPGGRGTPALFAVDDRVDLLTGTFGKALGGGSGGYVAGRQVLVDLLRQRARPYLFSNSLAPPVVAAARSALRLVASGDDLRHALQRNARRLRAGLGRAGFKLRGDEHPIIPVMLGDAAVAGRLAARLLEVGVYVVAFSYPVVPEGAARIRLQASAAMSDADIDRLVDTFQACGRELGLI